MHYGFIYETTCNITGRKYIGRRVIEGNSVDDEYLGSGTLLSNAIDYFGRENFTRKILEYCEDLDSLIEREEYWLNKVDAKNNPLYYNMTNTSYGYPVRRGDRLPKYWRDHMSESQKKRKPMSEETRRKLSIANTGKRHSEETKRKISLATRGRRHTEEWKKMMSERFKGEGNPNYGKPFSEESSKRQSISQKLRFSKNPPHNKGIPMTECQREMISNSMTTLWTNDDYREKQSIAHRGKIWMHNQDTLEKVYISPEESLEYEEKGWKRGRGSGCVRINLQ